MPQRITGHTELIGLIATPIRHSKSPMMHNTAFEALGLDYAYLAFDFPPENLEAAVQGLKALGVKGWNISMPYKTDIIPYLDEISEASRLCQSVNTVINRDGYLYGTVTDGTGYMDALADRGFDIRGKKITVLGCGGAATAICIQAALDGVREISIFNASDAFFCRAEENVEKIRANTGCIANAYPLEDKQRLRAEIADSVLLANGTSVGMGRLEGISLITDPTMLRPELIVTDVIYSPEETALLKLAREVGCPTMNGLGMMLYQGAAAFKLWTGKDMPIDAVKAVL
ncbi:MAG: shikimate dehydrogenase [Oscillospiraceae bacterium]|nr:shikimate dehydrogenase [Oscillospiraceae bacterium]